MKYLVFGAGVLIVAAGMASANAGSADDKPKTETVWTVELKGISGWSAAKTAKSARAALAKLESIDSVHVDTTARAILRMKKGESPDEQSLNAALKSVKCSVKTLEKTKVPLVAETIDITIEGLGWQSTAKSVREMLEKVDGVIVALPDGEDHKVLVHAKKAGALSEAAARQLIEENGKFKVKSFTAKKVVRKS